MFTRLLLLLNGGQNQSWWKLLKSDLKAIGVLFVLAFGLSVAIVTCSPDASIELDANQSQVE